MYVSKDKYQKINHMYSVMRVSTGLIIRNLKY